VEGLRVFQPRLLAHLWLRRLAGASAGISRSQARRSPRSRAPPRTVSFVAVAIRFPVVRAGVVLAVASSSPSRPPPVSSGKRARVHPPALRRDLDRGHDAPPSSALAISATSRARRPPVTMVPLVVAAALPTALWRGSSPRSRPSDSRDVSRGWAPVTLTAWVLGASPPGVGVPAGADGRLGRREALVALACGLASAAVVVLASDLVPAASGARWRDRSALLARWPRSRLGRAGRPSASGHPRKRCGGPARARGCRRLSGGRPWLQRAVAAVPSPSWPAGRSTPSHGRGCRTPAGGRRGEPASRPTLRWPAPWPAASSVALRG